jgi:triphosphatase
MTPEIELKYLIVNDNVVARISALLAQLQLKFEHSTKSLANCYFDSADLLLRQLDIGLRVRSTAGNIEQTIKTAGKVIGGLHQRPEYNINIESKFPNLSLFPQDIWPTEQDFSSAINFHSIEQLQAQLVSLFATDFERVTWLITNDNGSKIELVFDLGCITVEGASESICELEIELISGETNDLFFLAEKLAETFLLRPGMYSKAARGYALFSQHTLQKEQSAGELKKNALRITPLELIPLKRHYSIKQSFACGLEFSLNQLQKMIEAYCQQPSLQVLIKITELLALIRHGFWLFEQYLPADSLYIRSNISKLIKELSWVENAVYFQELTDKTGNYRKRLDYSEQLINQLKSEKSRFPDPESVIEIFYSPRFNLVQIALLKLLLCFEHHNQQQDIAKNEELLQLAQTKLEESLALLTNNLMKNKKLTFNEYLSQQKLLIRSLLTGSWYGGLYSKNARLEFRNPWLDVKQGMDELHTLLTLQQQLASISGEQSEKIHSWLDAKVNSLLLALDCSRKNAITINPYWR